MPNRRGRAPSFAWAALAVLLSGCAQAPVLRGRVAGLQNVVDEAEKNGAKRCAPRELATARSQLEFATVDLSQGELSNASAHVDIAEPNAKAALAMSPKEMCTEGHTPDDRDGDGIPDKQDKCPDKPENYNGFEDADGCPDDPDTDNDGIADSRDQCLLEPEDKDGYLDEDGCPDLDNDADGIVDTKDKCPDKAEDYDGFEDEDGCPDPDNDNDKIADVDDVCPNTPGPAGGERSGCPKTNSNIIITAREIRITQQIQFDTDKATIKPVSFKILDEVAQVLVGNPKIAIEVQGHTDNAGSADHNMKLSQARADSVRQYLVAHGVDVNRLVAKGYGMTQPLVKNDTAANKALNRRVQFIRTEK